MVKINQQTISFLVRGTSLNQVKPAKGVFCMFCTICVSGVSYCDVCLCVLKPWLWQVRPTSVFLLRWASRRSTLYHPNRLVRFRLECLCLQTDRLCGKMSAELIAVFSGFFRECLSLMQGLFLGIVSSGRCFLTFIIKHQICLKYSSLNMWNEFSLLGWHSHVHQN